MRNIEFIFFNRKSQKMEEVKQITFGEPKEKVKKPWLATHDFKPQVDIWQFTEIYDQRNTKIYEGSIVKKISRKPNGVPNLLGVVRMFEGSWMIINYKRCDAQPLWTEDILIVVGHVCTDYKLLSEVTDD